MKRQRNKKIVVPNLQPWTPQVRKDTISALARTSELYLVQYTGGGVAYETRLVAKTAVDRGQAVYVA